MLDSTGAGTLVACRAAGRSAMRRRGDRPVVYRILPVAGWIEALNVSGWAGPTVVRVGGDAGGGRADGT